MKNILVHLSLLAAQAPRYLPVVMMAFTALALMVGMRPPEGDPSVGR